MALVFIGLFVLVWVISAIYKASQDSSGKKPPASRQRPYNESRPIEKTSNSDIDRFMAEIDRLRRKGEGAPAGRKVEQPRPVTQRPALDRPKTEPRARPKEPKREPDRERRTRQSRPAPPVPPPLPRVEALPVLRPVTPDAPSTVASAPIKPARTRVTTATTVAGSAKISPVMETLQTVLRGKQGPAAAVILAEIFGEPRARQPIKPRISSSES
ncbi:MAG TPA: hypothetical protein VHR66_18375 [Gemmataceae bacterium]|nr:hypothetical protein [Gemmataceae bacterium]